MMVKTIAAFVLAGALTPIAYAQPVNPSPERLLDLSRPASVAAAVRELGYKAEIKNGDNGTPFISSAANGSTFSIDFYSCDKDGLCEGIQFYAYYKKAAYYSVAMTNEWNDQNRFLRTSIDKDGDLATRMDVSTKGKMTYANFADTFDWWTVMSAELFKFMDEKEKALVAKK